MERGESLIVTDRTVHGFRGASFWRL